MHRLDETSYVSVEYTGCVHRFTRYNNSEALKCISPYFSDETKILKREFYGDEKLCL